MLSRPSDHPSEWGVSQTSIQGRRRSLFQPVSLFQIDVLQECRLLIDIFPLLSRNSSPKISLICISGEDPATYDLTQGCPHFFSPGAKRDNAVRETIMLKYNMSTNHAYSARQVLRKDPKSWQSNWQFWNSNMRTMFSVEWSTMACSV